MRLPILLLCLALDGVLPTTAGPHPDRLSLGAAPRRTVAVLAFDNNTGDAEYDHLGQGMATMMTTDLSAVDDIQMLERERLADVTREIDAQHSSYFDSTTAVKVGRLAGAQYIVTGAFTAVKPQMRIDTRVIRVETGRSSRPPRSPGRRTTSSTCSRSSRTSW